MNITVKDPRYVYICTNLVRVKYFGYNLKEDRPVRRYEQSKKIAFISGYTYICVAVDGKPNRISVSGNFTHSNGKVEYHTQNIDKTVCEGCLVFQRPYASSAKALRKQLK